MFTRIALEAVPMEPLVAVKSTLAAEIAVFVALTMEPFVVKSKRATRLLL